MTAIQGELYFNTVPLSGESLKQHRFRAGSQNEMVLNLLHSNPGKSYTAWDIVRAFGWPERMKVSAGRALTSLTDLGLLQMTGEKVMESCGEWNNKWTAK
jgi:hypothetical protein